MIMKMGVSEYLKEYGKCMTGCYRDSSGRICKGNCIDGKKDGPWTIKDEKGNLLSIKHWLIGELQSEIIFHNNQKTVIYFKKNKKVAEFEI